MENQNQENYQDQLNQDIQNLLVEVFGKSSYDIKIEMTKLVKQIYRINQLIYRQRNRFIPLPMKEKKIKQLILWLDEVKNILLIVKGGNIEKNVLRQFRINLESDLNHYQYLFLGNFLNFFLTIYHIKSTPFKIFLGLLVTTTVSLVTMHFVIREINLLSQEIAEAELALIDRQNLENNPKINNESDKNTTITRIHNLNDNQILTTYFTSSLTYTAIAGVLGSITSILLRIIQFKEYEHDDPLVPFFFGMFKPLIGLLLGIFFFFFIKSDTIIQIDFMISKPPSVASIDQQFRQDFFLFTCAFIIGFSERFAADIIRTTQTSIRELESSNQGNNTLIENRKPETENREMSSD